jgi:hypothetical protein
LNEFETYFFFIFNFLKKLLNLISFSRLFFTEVFEILFFFIVNYLFFIPFFSIFRVGSLLFKKYDFFRNSFVTSDLNNLFINLDYLKGFFDRRFNLKVHFFYELF